MALCRAEPVRAATVAIGDWNFLAQGELPASLERPEQATQAAHLRRAIVAPRPGHSCFSATLDDMSLGSRTILTTARRDRLVHAWTELTSHAQVGFLPNSMQSMVSWRAPKPCTTKASPTMLPCSSRWLLQPLCLKMLSLSRRRSQIRKNSRRSSTWWSALPRLTIWSR